MGTRGPVPQRSDQRRRRNEPETPITKAPRGRSKKSEAQAAKGPKEEEAQAPTEEVEEVVQIPTVTIPPADPTWHDVAIRFYESLAESGQSRFYEPSDWAIAYLVAESMSRDLGEQVVGVVQQGDRAGEVIRDVIPLKGASLAAYLRACAVLGVTEGDRRRLQIELQGSISSDPNADRAKATITDLRSRLGG